MKKILLIISFLISTNVFSQTPLTIYYIIPPTIAGCDGVIAFSGGSWSNGCDAPFAFFTDCNSNTAWPTNGGFDTLFIYNVCTIPCSINLYSGQGLCAYCLVNPSLDIKENQNSFAVNFNSTDHSFEFRGLPFGKYMLSITDLTGRLVMRDEIEINNSFTKNQVSELNSGIYLYSLDGNKFHHAGRIAKQ